MAGQFIDYGQLAQVFDQERLGASIERLAKYGARDDGGVNRQAFTSEERLARAYLYDYAQQNGLHVFVDDFANMFFSSHSELDIDKAILTGSHLDSQPAGGKLDGAYGVIAALESLIVLNELGIQQRNPVVAVAWSNEEGCRFSPGAMGSRAYVTPELLYDYLDIVDDAGISVGQELETTRRELLRMGAKPIKMGSTPKAFIELHIEQGPKLEQMAEPLGVVTVVQGVYWFEVQCLGQAAHAGTTPMGMRDDAFIKAFRLISILMQWVEEKNTNDQLVCTIGRLEVSPNSINTIADKVVFTIDIRSSDDSLLQEFESLLAQQQAVHAQSISYQSLQHVDSTHFNDKIVASIQKACDWVNQQTGMGKAPEMVSGAFHDAVNLAAICPTGMIFVPSKDGISHNPKEFTPIDDLLAGVHALIFVLADLATTDSLG